MVTLLLALMVKICSNAVRTQVHVPKDKQQLANDAPDAKEEKLKRRFPAGYLPNMQG